MFGRFGVILPAILTVALAACGGGHPRGIPEGFGDADPYSWRGRGTLPSDQEIHGIDVSRWQGNVDWLQAENAGVRFAYIKATEGGEIADPQFLDHWYGAAQAGVLRGAYHFYFFCRSGAEQADWFIQHVPAEPGALPPVLDLEWTESRSCPHRPSPEEVRAEASDFLNIVGAHYGRRPIIYTSVDFWRDNDLSQLSGTEFWLRSVAGHPMDVYGGHHWTFWQYTSTGLVPGVQGQVDLNAFAGSADEWQAWLANHVM